MQNHAQILSFGERQSRQHKHPFLNALQHAEFGQLTLVTPEGHKREFKGTSDGPSAQLKLYDWKVLDELMSRGEMGFAETYIQGLWGSSNLADLLTYGLINAPSLEKFFHGNPLYAFVSRIRVWMQANTLTGSRRNIMAHYDLGNDFYKLWLDRGMTYSCALFEGDINRSLEEAQAAKYNRILGKLNAKPGEHILEIGCGWGGFAEAAAQQGLRVTTVTLSEEQMVYTGERLRIAGLAAGVSVMLADYREVSGQFDHIVSIGMFEHVGERFWPIYFETIKKRLKPGGKAMVQTITLDDVMFEKLHGTTGFVEQVIFPGGMLPSPKRFREEATRAGLVCHEMFAFGDDYKRTLEHWLSRFNAHKDEILALGYDESFLRLWRFYLCSCIAAMASKRTSVMQAELAHPI